MARGERVPRKNTHEAPSRRPALARQVVELLDTMPVTGRSRTAPWRRAASGRTTPGSTATPRPAPSPARRRRRSRLGEAAKQTPVADVREAREVEAAQVDLLHERRLRIDDAFGLEHAVDLVDAAPRIGDVLQHRLHDDGVHRAVGERQVVGVAEHRRRRVGRRIDVDDPAVRGVGQLADALSAQPAADHQHHRVGDAAPDQQVAHPRQAADRRHVHRRRRQPAQPLLHPRAARRPPPAARRRHQVFGVQNTERSSSISTGLPITTGYERAQAPSAQRMALLCGGVSGPLQRGQRSSSRSASKPAGAARARQQRRRRRRPSRAD